MKNLINLLFCLFAINCFSQSKDTIYFIIKKTDSLIKKQIATKNNPYEGYNIFYSQKKKVIMNNTPILEGKIWGNDSRYDYETLKYVSVPFNFDRKEDTIVTKEYLKTLNLITDREDFLKLEKKGHNFETLGFTYYFIESTKCDNKYIMRKVYPITFE